MLHLFKKFSIGEMRTDLQRRSSFLRLDQFKLNCKLDRQSGICHVDFIVWLYKLGESLVQVRMCSFREGGRSFPI